jgi:ribokinase
MSTARGSAAGRVIVVGSVNVDLVMRLPRLPVAGETVLGGVAERHHGGKGANQAVAAARAGAEVIMVGAVGARDGQDSIDALSADGVDVRFVARADVPTGLAVVLVDTGSGENQIAVAPGANDMMTARLAGESLAALTLRPADVIVLSFELPAAPLREAATLARNAGARLVVNPAPAQPRYADLLAGTICTPNMHELAALVPPPEPPAETDPRAAASALARRAGAQVVVTMGADGALLADANSSEHFRGHHVHAVDTTGAGDTLTGVLAAGLAQGYQLRVCVQRAVAAGALAVTRPGARAAMPTAAAIDDLLSGKRL